MAEKKYLFFDIDGTIWDFERRIPDSAVMAIKALRENGHETFLCSGRTMGHITSEKLLGMGFDGIISGCGTNILYHGSCLHLYEIPPEQLEWTLTVTASFQFQSILEGKDYLYFDTEYFSRDPYGIRLMKELNGQHHRTIRDYYGKWEASKLSCDTKKGYQAECYEVLKDVYDFIPHNSTVLEIVPKGYDKSRGIEMLCGMLNIPMEQTIAFGDSTNDMEMLSIAGIGVAMGNGSEGAKASADLVTDPLWDDGIYNACVRLGLIG